MPNPADITPDSRRSKLQRIDHPLFSKTGITVFVKRDDLIHEAISGNKWRKLKGILSYCQAMSLEGIQTFGGAFSNHIFATAAAGYCSGLKTRGYIRGETVENPTLKFAKDHGMQLEFLSRSAFRAKKNTSGIIDFEGQKWLSVPEGGNHELALPGIRELVEEVRIQLDTLPDYWLVGAGTGMTAAGIVREAAPQSTVMAVSALKGGSFLKREILRWNPDVPQHCFNILCDYHFGGYAKFTDDLLDFMRSFHASCGIPLDFVYTAKVFYALFDLCKTGQFKSGSTVVAVHTGGLQGNKGLTERFKIPKTRYLPQMTNGL